LINLPIIDSLKEKVDLNAILKSKKIGPSHQNINMSYSKAEEIYLSARISNSSAKCEKRVQKNESQAESSIKRFISSHKAKRTIGIR